MTKVILTRDKHLINIKIPDREGQVRYDLINKRMEKYHKGNWICVEKQYKFFRDVGINDIETEEKHFLELIEKTMKINPFCSSLSTFISRLGSALIYENYIQEGIEAECYASRHRYGSSILQKPLNFYRRDTINFFKNNHVMVTERVERAFSGNYEFLSNLVPLIDLCAVTEEVKKEVFEELVRSDYSLQRFKELVNVYKFDQLSLLKYFMEYLYPFENIKTYDGINLLCDYYKMGVQIGRNIKKYPKYLKSIHDILTANYNAYKQVYDEIKFEKLMKKELEFEGKEFLVRCPQNTKEIISEGASNNNCLASYVDKVINERCYILFLRSAEKKDESLVTLELIDGKIVQAKGEYNRNLLEPEKKFLINYCSEKKLKLEV